MEKIRYLTGMDDPRAPTIWDDKHPRAPVVYQGRPLPGSRKPWELDVRRFVWPGPDVALDRLFAGFDRDLGQAKALADAGDIDGAAWAVQRFVCRILEYVGDDKIGAAEFWLFPGESLALRRGDCEDGAILTASLCRFVGIPSWRIRIAAGMVDPGRGAAEGGHAWATFLRADQEWVALDWCYYADPEVAIADKVPLRNRQEYFGGDRIWFSFNDENAWSHEGEVRIEGRVRKGES